jgi:hypothetical protein
LKLEEIRRKRRLQANTSHVRCMDGKLSVALTALRLAKSRGLIRESRLLAATLAPIGPAG